VFFGSYHFVLFSICCRATIASTICDVQGLGMLHLIKFVSIVAYLGYCQFTMGYHEVTIEIKGGVDRNSLPSDGFSVCVAESELLTL
jgi:hypothetical protein